VRASGVWCQENYLSLNINKTKGGVRGLQETAEGAPPIHIERTAVEKVERFMFLGVHND
jgi:hypothetical protein